jgi:hypothetical protein
MKTRLILFISAAAIVTLSFTFVSVRSTKSHKVENKSKNMVIEPVGGLTSEGQL